MVTECGQAIRSLFRQRQPCYRRYAQLTIDRTAKSHDQIVTEIAEALG